LSDLPHIIENAKTAEDGIEKIKTQNFDLILMDIELPGINGDEATRKIRLSHDNTVNQIPIVALTGHTDDEQLKHYYNCGVNNVLSKPIDPSALIHTIENVTKGVFEKTPDIDIIKKIKETATLSPSRNEASIAAKKSPTPPPLPKVQSTSDSIHIEKRPQGKSPPTPQKPNISITENKNQTLDFTVLENLKAHLSLENIHEMTNEALEKSQEIITDLGNAVKTGNIEKIKSKSHDLKGMTGNFGLIEICNIAKELENKAKTHPPLVLSALIGRLPEAKKSAEKALSQWVLKNK
jgi:CheY-like chemotaxis protein